MKAFGLVVLPDVLLDIAPCSPHLLVVLLVWGRPTPPLHWALPQQWPSPWIMCPRLRVAPSFKVWVEVAVMVHGARCHQPGPQGARWGGTWDSCMARCWNQRSEPKMGGVQGSCGSSFEIVLPPPPPNSGPVQEGSPMISMLGAAGVGKQFFLGTFVVT